MKRRNRITIVLFLCMISMPTLIWLGVKAFAPATAAAWDYDLGEKRTKATIEWDALWRSGTSIEEAYNDRVPFRSLGVSFYQSMEGKLEAPYEQRLQPALLALLYQKDAALETQAGPADFNSFFGEQAENQIVTEVVEESDEAGHQHIYETMERVEPTCTENGLEKLLCSECGTEVEQVLPALGHTEEVLQVVEASFENYGYTECHCSVCDSTYRKDLVNKLIDDSVLPPKVVGGTTILGRSGWLFYTGNDSVAYFKGTNLLSEEKMAEYLEKVNSLQDLCDQKGIQLCLMFMPNKEQVYDEYMPTYTIETDYKRTKRLVDYLNENGRTPVIYPLEELEAGDVYWQVYHKYDTHWNQAGAFIGTMALYKALGREVTNPLELSGKSTQVVLTDLQIMGGLDASKYPKDYEFCVDYKPEVTVTEGNSEEYRTKNVFRTKADCGNEDRLVLLGDSYRAMMIPYLRKDFASATVAHRDYLSSVENDVKNATILVVAAVERYDARVFPTIDRLIEILSK